LELLRPQFRHQHLCRFSNWSGIAIASKQPLTAPGKCTDTRAMAAAKIDLNGRPVWLVSTHIHWPWPAPSEKAEAEAHALLAELDGPIAIAGDFNTLPWTHRLHNIRALSGTQRAGPVRASVHLRALPLPIDFALSPGGGQVEIRGKIGSDHAGLLASLTLSDGAQ
ncbi:MAG: hypothetical protein OXD48_02705, partial [Litoreibacter sp.]|nr:hypothetical protein [Litoreibacter sp.]